MFCEKCGNKLNNTDKFCPKCGNAIGQDQEAINNQNYKKKSNVSWKIPFILLGVYFGLSVLRIVMRAILDKNGFPISRISSILDLTNTLNIFVGLASGVGFLSVAVIKAIEGSTKK